MASEETERDVGAGVDPRVQVLLDDIPGAAKRVWEALSQRVNDDFDKVELVERDGVDGAIWFGSMNLVLSELWPFTNTKKAAAVPGAVTFRREIHHYLKASGNAVAVGDHANKHGARWFIPATWITVDDVEVRPGPLTAEQVRELPEEEKERRRRRIINRLRPYFLEQDRTEGYGITELARHGKAASVTIYGLFGTTDELVAKVNAELPQLRCPYKGCTRRFEKPNNLGRHLPSCPHRPEAIEKRDEETDIVTRFNAADRRQVEELKRRFVALIAFAQLTQVPISRSVMDDVAVSGFTLAQRRAAVEELLNSGLCRYQSSGGGAGGGRGFEVIVATDPRAALKGTVVDQAGDRPKSTGAAVAEGPAYFRAVFENLITDYERLKDRDAATADLRRALKRLGD